MLDIKFIKENPDLIKEAVRKKHIKFDVDELLKIEEERIQNLQLVENLRAEQNKVTEKISGTTDPVVREQLIGDMKQFKDHLKEKEDKLEEIMNKWRLLMLLVPNVPDASVPDGADESANQEIKRWGDIPIFDFDPKDHMELMTKLDMVDFERGTKVHGFRGYFLKGDGVNLCFAIWNYALQFFSSRGFIPMIPPVIVNKKLLYGTGHLPGDVEDYYMTQDGDALAGTAEVPLMGYHSNEILTENELPKKYLGFSSCFRREAGSYGKDVKGLIRVHEFFKFEQLILCIANHEESVKLHEEINKNTEEFIESMKIPYRTVINCGADLGLGQVKKYDIELWVPKEGEYREISSASYFHDFQTRRLNIRYKVNDGKTCYAHSLNSTAIPTPRVLVSIIENFQESDGSIKIPEVLQKYIGKDVIR